MRAGDETDCGGTASVELDLVMQNLQAPRPAASLVVLTALNSQYTARLADGRVRRDFWINPPTPCFTPNGVWQPVTLMARARLGESWVVHQANGMSCVSTVDTRVEAFP